MAGEQYADKARAALLSVFTANLPTQIAAVETAKGITLPRPDDYIDAKRKDDNRDQLLVYIDNSEELEGDSQLMAHDCAVEFHFYGDADFDEGHPIGTAIETAIRKTINTNPTLTSQVVSAIAFNSSYDVQKTTGNRSRHAVGANVRVITYG